jgi:hypothetical protein
LTHSKFHAVLSLNDKSDPSLTLFNTDKVQRSVFAIDQGGSGPLVLYGTAGGLGLCPGKRAECVDEVRKHRKRIPRAVGAPLFKIVASLSHRIGDVRKASRPRPL